MPMTASEAAFAHAMNASSETQQLKKEVNKLKVLAKVRHEIAQIERELSHGGIYSPPAEYDQLLEKEEKLMRELGIDE